MHHPEKRYPPLDQKHRFRPVLLYSALMGQWRFSLITDKLSVTKQIANRVYSLAWEQNDPALMIGAHHALGVTLYLMGDFESARQYVKRGVQIWRSGGVHPPVEQVDSPAIVCLCYQVLSEWHIGEIASCHTTMAEAMLLAKELNDMHGLAVALFSAARCGCSERDPAEVERYASDLIQLSTRQSFAFWLAVGVILRGWARSASCDPVEGTSWIEHGIRDYRATGSMLRLPYFLTLKAEALYLAHRTSETLEAIREAEALAESSGERWCSAELHRLRGVFLAAIGINEAQIEASFRTAIKTAKEQKSTSLEKRAEGTYAEYQCQKAGTSGGNGFRLTL